MGEDCLSPSSHAEFSNTGELIEFVERIADATGLPVGIKSAVGTADFWQELASLMRETGRGPDYIFIDGGEGGTGAGPLAFSNFVSLPFKIGFSRVYRIFAEAEMHQNVVFLGAGRLGFPAIALFAMALGCDMVSVAREAMLSIGCIQAQRCHTGHCPTGVATQNRWLIRGLDPTDKSARLANYIVTLRKELLHLSHSCGKPHPALVGPEHIEILDGRFGSSTLDDLFGYVPGFGLPSAKQSQEIRSVMSELAATD